MLHHTAGYFGLSLTWPATASAASTSMRLGLVTLSSAYWTCIRLLQHMDVHLLSSACSILLGNFNCFEDAVRDVRGPDRDRATWNSHELLRFTSHFYLEDVWVRLHGHRFKVTWQRGSSVSRLERFYMPPSLLNVVTSCDVQHHPWTPAYVSDHHPVLLTLCVPSDGVPCPRCWWIDGGYSPTLTPVLSFAGISF